MLNEKKTAVSEEVKEEVRKLTEEELENVNGGGNEPDPLARYSSPCRAVRVE